VHLRSKNSILLLRSKRYFHETPGNMIFSLASTVNPPKWCRSHCAHLRRLFLFCLLNPSAPNTRSVDLFSNLPASGHPLIILFAHLGCGTMQDTPQTRISCGIRFPKSSRFSLSPGESEVYDCFTLLSLTLEASRPRLKLCSS